MIVWFVVTIRAHQYDYDFDVPYKVNEGQLPEHQHYFSPVQSIQGDLGSWFGYDFDFDEVDDNVRLFVGAPRQQAVYYSDYDVNEWKNARQLPQQLLYHEQHITTRFVGAVVRCQGEQLIVCDPLLEIDLGCKSVHCHDEFGSVKQFVAASSCQM
jgi:hypothetical protein